ncbi:Lipopolysaccharide assembly protein A [Andreprevotia sp. IGB-42]|uniref:LapA family protein n=1 Tax=Andreprevotia sp. IGB-42 TaxID=2497473 RepID=UPI00135C6C13|nr:LapA family protein [Andreprevotia sp. IGB-42]KAF0815018.1 Lipopolysaccharide assembly protein A [Andreprevotia sp. IGB-42]
MRYLIWFVQFVFFVIALGFALRNAQPVTLNFFVGYAWTAPLVLQLLAFFVLGAMVGALALLGKVIHYRREVIKLRRELRVRTAATPPAPDLVLEQPRDAV